jgi:FMN phosphatase YigB (HAD superfamily)
MGIKAVLFDLDGTLLPMDQEIFTKEYFASLAKNLAKYGYESDKLIKSIWIGSAAMVKNIGSQTNEEVFWNKFSEIYGDRVREDKAYFEAYYFKDFDRTKSVCGYNPKAVECVNEIKSLGIRIALATNPLFPSIATEKRANWAGLDIKDFELYTTYENSHFAKPNPEYYGEILQKMQISPDEVLMVGNDVTEDMVADTLGMKVFLITDNLINKENKDISIYPNGNFDDLINYVKENA